MSLPSETAAQKVTDASPKWLRDIEHFLSLKSHFLLSGNLRDLFVNHNEGADKGLMPLSKCLWGQLTRIGYQTLVTYDPVDGIDVADEESRQWLQETTGLSNAQENHYPVSLDKLSQVLGNLVRQTHRHVAVIMDYASRMIPRPDGMDGDAQRFFVSMLKLSHDVSPFATGSSGPAMFNSIFWLTDQENDLPTWLSVANPRSRTVMIPSPDGALRRQVANRVAMLLPGFKEAAPLDQARVLSDFTDSTNGLLCRDILAIAQLARTNGIPYPKISDAVRQFKIGVVDDPWLRLDYDKMANGEAIIGERVKGQGAAVQKAMDIIKRAITGLSGAQASKSGGRPRGILFLAGPTGTGKTELAKSLTSLIFGDEEAYIRFDMSEFSAEHADQRLLGAPPGYVGFDAGGELTNAIRQKPFSVVLFDEIEKAHPRILDKFLQLLDDGVMTSGRGERVYFSEAIIVFTSNLGIYRKLADGTREANVSQNDPADQVEVKVRKEIERYFKEEINRPELLNRIGENIVVFDFIRPAIAEKIFEKNINGIRTRMQTERDLILTLSEKAYGNLRERCLHNLDNGGRGIGNQIEALFINPLSRRLFELPDYGRGKQVNILDFEEVDGIPTLTTETT
ncbi:MAG: AAA family ATPase [Verrucomicrobiota bacterium]